MNALTKIELPRPARAGTERKCQQCGRTYHSPRSTSRFCSGTCRIRHHRGSAKGNPTTAPTLRSWLLKRSYLSRLSPRGSEERWGLTVSPALAMGELNAALEAIHARGLHTVLPVYTEATFRTALRAANIAA